MEENYNLLEPHHFGEKPPKGINNLYIWIILAAVAASLLTAIYLTGSHEEAKLQPDARQAVAPPSSENHRLTIIIDDLGHNFEAARRFIELELPLSFAVLPQRTYSKRIAELAREKGREVMLHLPMEPYDYPETNPGPGAILAHMTKQELIDMLEKDLASVPQAIGVSNHMGSFLTSEKEVMETVMGYLKVNDLFFVDSLTAPDTVAYKVAKKMDVKAARRTMFLDNIQDVQAITENIMLMAEKSRKIDGLIAIAHPYPTTYEAFKLALPRLRENGIEVVPISELIK